MRPEQRRVVGRVDLLLLPVGGGPTIGAHRALERVRQGSLRWMAPMHYRTLDLNFLEPAAAFLAPFERVHRPAVGPGGSAAAVPHPGCRCAGRSALPRPAQRCACPLGRVWTRPSPPGGPHTYRVQGVVALAPRAERDPTGPSPRIGGRAPDGVPPARRRPEPVTLRIRVHAGPDAAPDAQARWVDFLCGALARHRPGAAHQDG